jgi:hypothetical protein
MHYPATTGPHTEPGESNQHPHITLLNVPSSILLSYLLLGRLRVPFSTYFLAKIAHTLLFSSIRATCSD